MQAIDPGRHGLGCRPETASESAIGGRSACALRMTGPECNRMRAASPNDDTQGVCPDLSSRFPRHSAVNQNSFANDHAAVPKRERPC